MSNVGRDRWSKVATAVALWSCASGHAVAATIFPGAAPCNTILQACTAGDTIELATNGLINEDVDIEKSLTLQPATGFAPQLLATASTSDAVDHGNSAVAPSGLDLAGNARVQGSGVDIGALESSFAVAPAPPTGANAPALDQVLLFLLLCLILATGLIPPRMRIRSPSRWHRFATSLAGIAK